MKLLKLQLPLRQLLVAPFLIQTFFAVGVVGVLSFQNEQTAVNDLAYQLIDKSEQIVEQHLDTFLSVPHQINAVSEDAIFSGLLNPEDYGVAGRFYWQQATLHDVSWAGYALPSGELVGAGKWIEDAGVSIAELSSRTDQKLYNYSTDDLGNRIERIQIDDYVPTEDKWYLNAKEAEEPVWSPIYAAAGLDSYITVSASRPVYGPDQELQAILVVDLLLSSINQFLDQLRITPSAQVFIIDRQGQLVGSSSAEQYALVKNDTDSTRLDAIKSADPLIQAAATYIQQNLGGFQDISDAHSLKFRFAEERQFLGISQWQDEYGLDWLVVTVIPESDFMTQIKINRRTTVLLSCLALLGVTTFGLLTARWISQPLALLGRASTKLAKAARDRTIVKQAASDIDSSHISELNDLAQAFNEMAEELRQAFADLEAANVELEDRVDQRTTELKETLHKLKVTQVQMLHNEKMSALGQMVAGIAHEVNNPINFVHGNLNHTKVYIGHLLELIELYQQKQTTPDSEIDEFIEEIDLEFLAADLPKLLQSMRLGSERIREIVKSLRTFSRLDEAEFKEADIHEGIDSTLLLLQHRIKGKSGQAAIEIIKDYEKLPKVKCYPGQFNQVLMNILANAIDALEEKATFSAIPLCEKVEPISALSETHPVILIQTRLINNKMIRITITDNGGGIPEAIKTRIFDPFFTTKDVGRGTGMGLAISHEIIVQKHRGSISCVSVPGQGVQFIIEIPVQQDTNAQFD